MNLLVFYIYHDKLLLFIMISLYPITSFLTNILSLYCSAHIPFLFNLSHVYWSIIFIVE